MFGCLLWFCWQWCWLWMNFNVEWHLDENEVTSAMAGLHQGNKVYVLLSGVHSSVVFMSSRKHSTGLSRIPCLAFFPHYVATFNIFDSPFLSFLLPIQIICQHWQPTGAYKTPSTVWIHRDAHMCLCRNLVMDQLTHWPPNLPLPEPGC